MFDDGVLVINSVENIADKGDMPVYRLSPKSRHYYSELTVGVTRYYAAQKANARVDKLVRIWRNNNILIDDVCILQDGLQYRIGQIQQTFDDDKLVVTDLSLERLENNYDT